MIDHPIAKHPVTVLGITALIWGLVYGPFLSFSVSDFRLHVGPWLEYIRSNGGVFALSDDFSEYAPPYLYLLTLLSYFDFPFSDQVLVKLINAPFVLLSSVSIYYICRHFEKSAAYALMAACCVTLLPTLGINAFIWGQADAIYSAFAVASVAALLYKRPYLAVALFSLSLSTKLQSLFLAPFLLMMTVNGAIPWRAWFLSPVVYLFTILPSLLFGRPLTELLTVYLVQGKFYRGLSLNAPNPYIWGELLFQASAYGWVYRIGTLLGLVLSTCAGVAIAAIGYGRKALSGRAILLAATLSVLIMPFILPKMHDRYFIIADLLCLALALIDRRFIFAAVAMQISSSLAMAPEFSLFGLPGDPEAWVWGVGLGAIINLVVIVNLTKALSTELGGLWIWPSKLKWPGSSSSADT